VPDIPILNRKVFADFGVALPLKPVRNGFALVIHPVIDNMDMGMLSVAVLHDQVLGILNLYLLHILLGPFYQNPRESFPLS
jgi:hypothetical protein